MIDYIPKEYFNIFYKLYNGKQNLINLNKLIGNIDEINSLDQNYKKEFVILLKIPFYFSKYDQYYLPNFNLNNSNIRVDFKINDSILDKEHVYLLCNSKETIIIECEEEKITPSFLRSFSAPVYLKTDLQEIDYLHILKYDNDAFNKWDAAQNLYFEYFIKNKDVTKLTDLLKSLISSNSINNSLMSLLIELPSRASLENLLDTVDPIDVFYKRQSLMKEIALNLKTTLENVALHLAEDEIFLIKNQGHRSLLGKVLNYLVLIGSQIGIDLAKRFAISKNMTLSIAALRSLCLSDSKLVMPYLEKFYSNWKNNDLVLEKWFEIMSSINIEGEGLSFVKKLLKHKDFDNKNPNKLRSVLGTFQKENIILFHSEDMSGYKFIAEQISQIDKYNPQVASRLILPMTQFRSFQKERKENIISILKDIYNQKISNDLSEILEKAIS